MSGHSGKSGSVNAHESPCIENAGATQFILRYLIPGQEKYPWISELFSPSHGYLLEENHFPYICS